MLRSPVNVLVCLSMLHLQHYSEMRRTPNSKITPSPGVEQLVQQSSSENPKTNHQPPDLPRNYLTCSKFFLNVFICLCFFFNLKQIQYNPYPIL
jgi:hypothetical protein